MAKKTSEEKIMDNALAPAKASGDAGAMEQHPIPDQIAADKYAAAKKASRAGKAGIKPFKFTPPGTVC